MKNKRGLLIIFFILTLFMTNIVKASEGVSPGSVRQPSFSYTGGAAEPETKTVQEVLTGQNQTTAQPPAPKEEKNWAQKLNEASKKASRDGSPRTPLTTAISYLIKFITVIFTFVIVVSLVRIVLHLMKQRSSETREAEAQQQSKKEEVGPSNISDAVVSFVRHRLKK